MKEPYQIIIRYGRYPREYEAGLYECKTFIWFITYWKRINFVRGQETLIQHMANRWCEKYSVHQILNYTE